jgi:hypothetical protein
VTRIRRIDSSPPASGCIAVPDRSHRTVARASWLGLDDAALLISCAESGLVLVAFDRATLPWHAGQVLPAGDSHGGLILFRRTVRSTNYGDQVRLLTEFWFKEGHAWDWMNRIVYLPKSP